MRKLFLLFIFFMVGCIERPKIEKGDIVIKCVITECEILEPNSTIEPGYNYKYYTNCGEVLTTKNSSIYHIGDTITYVYKKKKY
jgi:hypothetical protein